MYRVDITGQRFGKLTAIKRCGKDKYGNTVWECQCDCGNITKTSLNALRSGTKTCGCSKQEHKPRHRRKKTEYDYQHMNNSKPIDLHKNHYNDITGQKFGRLTAVEHTDMKVQRRSVWKCQCDCGNITYVDITSLRTGNTQSCGCRRKKHVKEYKKSDAG